MAQLNVVNPAAPTASNSAAACTAFLAFVDDTGKTIVSKTVSVPPGKSLAVGAREEVRGTITITPSLFVSNTLEPISFTPCALIPSLEVLDSLTGKTQFVMVETTHEANLLPPTPVANP